MTRYIDADEIIKSCDRVIEKGLADKNGEHPISVECVKKKIEDIPTADVRENVYGEWVLNHMSQLWECSNCHKEEIRTTDFCPRCGADMRKEVEK